MPIKNIYISFVLQKFNSIKHTLTHTNILSHTHTTKTHAHTHSHTQTHFLSHTHKLSLTLTHHTHTHTNNLDQFKHNNEAVFFFF